MPKQRNPFFKRFSEINPIHTSHGVGNKYVLATQKELGKPITQIAQTKLNSGEVVCVHMHPTMDEHFFLLEGECVIVANDVSYRCMKNDYLCVTAGCPHQVEVISDTTIITIGIEIK